MSIKDFIKTTVKKCDLFSQQVTFRYGDEPQFETVTGGCISIIIIITFIGIFSTTLLKTVNRQFIHFTLSRTDEQSPSYFVTTLDKHFMFAIGLDNIDLNSGERYFNIFMEFRHYHGNIKDKISLSLVPCEKAPWEQRGFYEEYNKLKFNRWLCPFQMTQISLQGKFSSDNFKFYKIAVKQCDPNSDLSRPCANLTTINSYLSQNQAFNINFYFINTIINPGDKTYLSTYLEDVNYFPFSTTNGVNANLFISSFKIETDQSIWPYEDIQTDEGGIVLESSQVRNYEVSGTEYMKIFLRKSPISLSIQRSFRKVDDALSYIGGLFSVILVFFSFMNLFNELSYEIQITKQIFYYDKNDPFQKDDFNLLTFIRYLIFCLFEGFGIVLAWPQYQRLHRFLEEGRKQIDLRLIMQKIVYTEKLGLFILNKNKHKALLLSQPFTLNEADEIRKNLSLFKSICQKFSVNEESKQLNENNQTNENLNSQTQLQINLNENVDRKNSFEQKNNVSQEKQIVVNQSQQKQQKVNKEKQPNHQIQKKQPQTVQKEQELDQLDVQMKQCLNQLQNQINKKDKLANKIMDMVDPQIKKKYLQKQDQNNEKPLKQLSLKKKNDQQLSKEV